MSATQPTEQHASVFDELRRVWDFEDVIASRLATIQDELAHVDALPEHRAPLRRAVQAAADVRDALQTLSSLSRGKILSGTTLEGAIRARLSRQDADGPTTSFTVVGEPVPLDRMSVHDIVMVFHEAFENVIRHARAPSVRIGLVYAGSSVMLLVEDDGVGYSPDTVVVERGLRRMKERTIEHSGSFTTTSVPGWGTTLRATFPVTAVRRSARERATVLVADPRAVVVAGLASLAVRADPHIAVIGEFTAAADAVRAVALARPRLVLVGSGFDHETPSVIQALRAAQPDVQIVVISDADMTPEILTEIRSADIAALLDARAGMEEALDAIVAAARGDSARRAWQNARPDLQQPTSALTDREREVRELLLEGASNLDIADTLGLSVRTVEKHVSSLLRKVGARNRVDLLSSNKIPRHRTV